MVSDQFSKAELRVEEWLHKANDDELNAKSILTHRDGTPNGVCLHAHQMAEKILKAFLVSRTRRFPKIHPLDTLVEGCGEIDPTFDILQNDAIFLNKFYTPVRYPADTPEFSWKDAEEAFTAALRIKEFVLRKLTLL